MRYECSMPAGSGCETHWNAELHLLKRCGPYREFVITGRDTSFHGIEGPQQNGNFLCLTNWNVGCELASLSDIFWNRESLSRHLAPVDAATVACGLKCLGEMEEEK